MGWSYRKSFGSGPFRINFSKSGISYSVGIKGARINMGPRGTYVNLSSHGISYRQKLSQLPVPQKAPANNTQIFASAQVAQLTDSDSRGFIKELTEKASKPLLVNWLGIWPLIIFLAVLAFTSYASRTIITQPAKDSLWVQVEETANLRRRPSARSKIITAVPSGSTLALLDSSDQRWLKTDSGYISRRFARIARSHTEAISSEETYLRNPYAVHELLAGILFFGSLIVYLKKTDRRRLEMELNYDMDQQFQQVYEQFRQQFQHFSRSARIWQYLNAQATNDYKRTGGAGKLIKRSPIAGIAAHRLPIPYLVTNVTIPYLKLYQLELFFLPERLLLKRGATFAAVFYKNLRISGYTTRFIEDEAVPSDARIVDRTWRYLNKSGGPDRRFNNNRQIPICAYSEYTITSDTGIYEVITTSKEGAMDGLAHFLSQIGQLQKQLPID